MPDDVLLNKCEIVERCLKRIQEDYEGHESELSDNFMRQDAILLNIQRMCQASIDLVMHVVRVRALGLPRESRGAFELLKSAQLMDAELADKIMKMVGFRNLAAHNYQSIDLEIVHAIINQHLNDFRALTRWAIRHDKKDQDG